MAGSPEQAARPRSPLVTLVLAAVAAVSALAIDVFAWTIAHTVRDTGYWVAFFLPVVAIDALIMTVGLPRALADLRRAGRAGTARWQPVCALILFAVTAAAVVVALWLFASRNAEPLP